jgi:hypothetical protein
LIAAPSACCVEPRRLPAAYRLPLSPATIPAALKTPEPRCPRTVVLSLLVAGALVGLPRLAPGDEPARKDVQFWTPTIFQTNLTPRWALQFDTQIRLIDNLRALQNSLVRPSVVFMPGRRLTLNLGYAWVPYFHPARTDEHRLWQQVMLTVRTGGWTLLPRVRFEQRRIPVVDRVSFRLRGQVKVLHALPGSSRWQLSVSDEVFFNLNDVVPAPARGFATNRTQIGLVRRVTPRLSVETGYLLQYANRPRPLADEIDRVVTLNTVVRF